MRFEFDLSALDKKLNKLETLYDDASEGMLNAGAEVVANRLRKTKFGKYVRTKKPKKNKFGWFTQVIFKGKTESGASAALAASVYEFGRGGYHRQPARPEIRPAVRSVEKETVQAMEDALDKELKKI